MLNIKDPICNQVAGMTVLGHRLHNKNTALDSNPITAKCIYLHIEDTKSNGYSIGEVPESVARSHKDLGVKVSQDRKTAVDCREVSSSMEK